jgi:hypothetical protein
MVKMVFGHDAASFREGLPAMLLSDLALRACAQQVMKQHGGKAPLHVASCIDELSAAGGR